MYDPMTMIHQIKIGKFRLLTVWHVDPEADGTDDSCRWFSPKVTECEEKIIAEMVDWDIEMPYYSSPYLPLTIVNPKYDYNQMLAGDCLAYVSAAWRHISWARDKRSKLTIDEWWNMVNLAVNPHDNLRAVLVDPEESAKDKVERFCCCVMKAYLRYHRPWWRHPRWHIYHWEFQVHFTQTLKRWLFSHCAYCGERFPWGYSPTSSGGNSKGPRWFKSEEHCYHHHCYDKSLDTQSGRPCLT